MNQLHFCTTVAVVVEILEVTVAAGEWNFAYFLQHSGVLSPFLHS
jgi:hypothetical protein